MTKLVINVATGNAEEVELTPEEQAALEIERNLYDAQRRAKEAKQAQINERRADRRAAIGDVTLTRDGIANATGLSPATKSALTQLLDRIEMLEDVLDISYE